jgi:hypothetical protein
LKIKNSIVIKDNLEGTFNKNKENFLFFGVGDTILSKDQFKNYLHNQAGLINYKNFKSEVAITRGKKFSTTLLSVWSAMHEVEDKEARKR